VLFYYGRCPAGRQLTSAMRNRKLEHVRDFARAFHPPLIQQCELPEAPCLLGRIPLDREDRQVLHLLSIINFCLPYLRGSSGTRSSNVRRLAAPAWAWGQGWYPEVLFLLKLWSHLLRVQLQHSCSVVVVVYALLRLQGGLFSS
jgi:hypothetical protein